MEFLVECRGSRKKISLDDSVTIDQFKEIVKIAFSLENFNTDQIVPQTLDLEWGEAVDIEEIPKEKTKILINLIEGSVNQPSIDIVPDSESPKATSSTVLDHSESSR